MRKLGILVLSLVCAVAFGADIKHPRGTSAAEVRGIVATSTVPAAAVASALVAPGGSSTWTIDSDMLTIMSTTNIVGVVVTATNGAGYNGPAVGVVFYPDNFTDGVWTFLPESGDFEAYTDGSEADPFTGNTYWGVIDGINAYGWLAASLSESLSPTGDPEGSTGTLSIARATATTNIVYDLSSLKVE